ncbi:methyltransferase domain-containing protein [Micromonospora sp. WMMC415]|uniref:methyltransferase domain-containing protein n=1 Tax=Micromonospora sp. WMMC415 TaxID=2675222 RepID=UPI0012B49B17|nr:methyltransferase domain-containing protein [Micromonospora sp. WMMC415]QGN48389.1 methyltransferase domain-containing protein [Micromonospora sp. WMMC415]
MTVDLPAGFADWLTLREPADAAARATDLVDRVRSWLTGTPLVVHDLGCGTGSMGRWLAPRLPGPQHWILHDGDAGLLARAAADLPAAAADGAPVTVETRPGDLTRLTAADLAGASLVTASALLDMLTADEVERVVAACAGRPALFALSVVGRVRFDPVDALDTEIAEAFNEHQRRTVGGRALLGPDAVDVAAAAFVRHGADVVLRPSPWRLGPKEPDLFEGWFAGWLDAACEQRPELIGPVGAYARSRRAAVAAGRLTVLIDHRDLLALPTVNP